MELTERTDELMQTLSRVLPPRGTTARQGLTDVEAGP